MRTVGEFVAWGVVIALVGWCVLFLAADRERRPVIACAPAYYTVGAIHRAWAAATDRSMTTKSDGQQRPVQDSATLACLEFVDRFNRIGMDVGETKR
jgi:hypothetical protein